MAKKPAKADVGHNSEREQFINKELAGKFDEDGGSELISGADPFENEPVTEAAE